MPVSQLLSCHSLRFRSFAYTCRYSEGRLDICIKMTTPSQLGTLRGKIDGLEEEILDTKKALAAAHEPADIAFLRQRLGALDKKEIVLREEKNILLQGQASGEHCLPRYLLLLSWPSSMHTYVKCHETVQYSDHQEAAVSFILDV